MTHKKTVTDTSFNKHAFIDTHFSNTVFTIDFPKIFHFVDQITRKRVISLEMDTVKEDSNPLWLNSKAIPML